MGIESPAHLLFIAIVALIVLGPKRLPGLARALGQGIREFRSSLEAGGAPPEGPAEPGSPPARSAPLRAATAPAPPSPEVGERASGESSGPERPRESAS